MRVASATDHGGFCSKRELVPHLRDSGHQVIDFGACTHDPDDDHPDSAEFSQAERQRRRLSKVASREQQGAVHEQCTVS